MTLPNFAVLLTFVFLCSFWNRKGKGKPNGKKPLTEEKKHYLDAEYTKVRVVDFDLKELVVLPREIDLNEWLACNSMCLVFSSWFTLIKLRMRLYEIKFGVCNLCSLIANDIFVY